MPRKKKPIPIDPPTEAAVQSFDVTLHRIIEQSAVHAIKARSRQEAEDKVLDMIDDQPEFCSSLRWVDGEIEQTESIVLVQESKVKGNH